MTQTHRQRTVAGNPRTSWTAREIAIVSNPALSVYEMAKQVNHTYQAVVDFRRDNNISEARASVDARRSDRVEATVLCPCASFDGDHEDWCPDA